MRSITEALRVPKSSSTQTNETPSNGETLINELNPSAIVAFVGDSTDSSVTRMLDRIGSEGKLVLIDCDKERLSAAQRIYKSRRNIVFIDDRLDHLSLSDQCFDFIWSRFSLEDQKYPRQDFEQLTNLCKCGGWALFEELDQSHLNHFPLSKYLSDQLLEIAQRLSESRLWDPWVGRKLFSFFSETGFQNIQVEMKAHQTIYGGSDSDEILEWKARMEQAHLAMKSGQFRLSFDLKCCESEFLAFFENPHRFSYSPLISVSGKKAE